MAVLNKWVSSSFLLIAIILAACIPSSALADFSIDRISDKAVAFVQDRVNASMGLCSEVVEGTPNSIGFSGSVYWIYSDNVLAYALLRQHNLTIANILRQSLLNYASANNLDTDSNGFPIDFKHEPILSAFVTEDFNGSVGDSFPSNFVPRNAILRDLNVSSSFKVCTEIDNGTNFTDYSGYVDWLAWIGLSYLNVYVASQRTNTTAFSLAIQYYNDMMKFWQGNGFHDKRYDYLHYYETFKLGLAIYFRKALDGAGANIIKPNAENTMERIIEICQQNNGGVCVNYDDSLDVWGNPNVETTALVGLAGIVKIPESCRFLEYQDQGLQARVNAANYLISNYNSTVGLLAEVPSWDVPVPEDNHLYWIGDNMLAYFALRGYNTTISNDILNTIKTYAVNYSLPVDGDGIPIDYKHEVLVNITIPDNISNSSYYEMSLTPHSLPDGAAIKNYSTTINPFIVMEVNNNTVIGNWMDYADLQLYMALNDNLKGQTSAAVALYNSVVNMWDGYGLNDIIARRDGVYDVYKLCLLEYARKMLNQPYLPYEVQMINTIFSAQYSNGGILTDYDETEKFPIPGVYTNTETTAIFLLANIEPPSITSMQYQISSLNQQVSNLTQQIATLTSQIAYLTQRLDGLESQVTNLSSEQNTSNQLINDLTSQIANFNSQISNLEAQIEFQTLLLTLATGAIAMAAVIAVTYLFYNKRKRGHAPTSIRSKDSGEEEDNNRNVTN